MLQGIESEQISVKLSELQASGIVLKLFVAEEKALPVSEGFRAKALLMPNHVQKQLRAIQLEATSDCFFCGCEDEVLAEEGDYKLVANKFPYVEDQVMVVPVKHRDLPSEKDFASVLAFQRQVGLTGMLNLSGSGASLPDHLHFEFGKANLPILQLATTSQSVDYYGTSVDALKEYPGLALNLQDDDISRLATNTNSLTHTLLSNDVSFNLIITGDRILVIPRVAALAWGSLYLGGLHAPDCRNSKTQDPTELLEVLKDRYSSIDAMQYKSIIKSVTLPEIGAREFVARLHSPSGLSMVSRPTEQLRQDLFVPSSL